MSATERQRAADAPPTAGGEPAATLIVRFRRARPAPLDVPVTSPFDGKGTFSVPAPGFTMADVLATLPHPAAATLPGARPLAGIPLPIVFCRTLDGWGFFATPDDATWRTFCVTFLNRDVLRRFDAESAWRSAPVFNLVELVLGTYTSADFEGRCHTFGVPCAVLVDSINPMQAPIGSGTVVQPGAAAWPPSSTHEE